MSEVISNMPEGFEKLATWLERHGAAQVHTCMEATGIYWKSAVEFLTEAGHAVSVVNPAQISAFSSAVLNRTKRTKKMPRLSPVPPRIGGRRDALERMRTQEKNRLHVYCGQVRSSIEEHLAFFGKAIQDIDAEIQRKTDGDASLKKQRELLNSVPGLGVKTVPVQLSFFIGKRFSSPRQPAAASVESREYPKWAMLFPEKTFTCPR